MKIVTEQLLNWDRFRKKMNINPEQYLRIKYWLGFYARQELAYHALIVISI